MGTDISTTTLDELNAIATYTFATGDPNLKIANAALGAEATARDTGAKYFRQLVSGVTTWVAANSGNPSWSSITGKPTDLTGYGITAADPVLAGFVKDTGDTMTGTLTLSTGNVSLTSNGAEVNTTFSGVTTTRFKTDATGGLISVDGVNPLRLRTNSIDRVTIAGAGSVTVAADLTTGGSLRATGSTTFASGAGAEVQYSSPNANFLGFDRTSSVYIATRLIGLTVALLIGGTSNGAAVAATGAMTMTTTGAASDIILAGSPTNNRQIQLGNSSVFGSLGTRFSGGEPYVAYNAAQTTATTDSWTQSSGTFTSMRMMMGGSGFQLHVAPTSRTAAINATFWGSPIFSVTQAGLVTVNGGMNLVTNDIITSGGAGVTGDFPITGNVVLGGTLTATTVLGAGQFKGMNSVIGVGSGYTTTAVAGWRLGDANSGSSRDWAITNGWSAGNNFIGQLVFSISAALNGDPMAGTGVDVMRLGLNVMTVAGAINPDATATYDLGTSSTRWRSLYLSAGAIMAGSLAIGTTLSVAGASTMSDNIQITGNVTTPSSGVGLELIGGSAPRILAYNRGTAAYVVLNVDGSTVNIRPSGTTVLAVASSGIAVTGTISKNSQPVPAVYTGTAAPASGLGVNGDLYVQTP